MSLVEYLIKFNFSIPGPQDLVKHQFKKLLQLQKRMEIAELLEQEDWMLKDMGIDRNDVRAALAQPDDPGIYLDRCRNRTIRADRRSANKVTG